MASRMFEIAFQLAGRVGSSFNSMFTSANDRMRQLNQNGSTLRNELRNLERAQQAGTISAREYAEAYARLTRQLQQAERAQLRYSRAVSMQQRVGNFRGQMQSNMMGASAAAAPFAGASVVGIKFETAMAGVLKQVDGARTATGEMTEIGLEAKNRIMQASKDMMIMPDTMAQAFAMAARSGVKGQESIDRFARMGTRMGTAFEAPVEQITEDFAKVGSAMNIDLSTEEGIDKLEALADTVNYLDDQTNAKGSEIIDVLKRIGGTATALLPTLSRNTLAGISTGLLQMAETPETAGTALNSLLTKVAAAPAQAKPFQEALDSIGISAEELQAGALKDAEGTILGLFERIGKLDAGKRNNVLAELFGAEYIDTLSKISGNYDSFIEVIKKGNSEAAKGSMNKEFDIISKTTERQLEGTKAAIARTSIEISNNLQPSILSGAQGFNSFLEKVQKFTAEHPNLTKFIVGGTAGFIGFALAASALGWVVSSVISPFVSFYAWAVRVELMSKLSAKATKIWTAAQWLWNAAISANPIGLVIIGIAALIGIGYALIKNWDTVKAWFTLLWNDPTAAMQQFIDAIRNKFAGVFKWLEEKWKKLKALFSKDNATGGGGIPEDATPEAMERFASGGFANRPSIFGEAGPEAAIPLDGSARSLSLWERTGELLGVSSAGNESGIVYAPVINAPGGDPRVIRRVLDESRDDFLDKYREMKHQERRLAYV